MTKQRSNKLPLRTESIRMLSAPQLGTVAAGSFGTLFTATTNYTSGGPGTSSLAGGGTYTPSSKI
jgi:hypothetical protein